MSDEPQKSIPGDSTANRTREFLSTALYIAMGWIALIAIRPIVSRVPAEGILWLLAGGLAYTGGVVFYAMPRARYAHLAWHLCVLAGSLCHFVAVFRFSS